MNKKILRKFGFKNDQQGIINRYIRENGGWEQHLENTRQFILESAKSKNKAVCVIIGSGWLLDVPIDELSELFGEVLLIDIVHPKQIIHKIKKLKNVNVAEFDITGLIELVYYFLKDNTKEKQELTVISADYDNDLFEKIINADFVVSVNILNQLDILICDYIKKFDIYSEQEIKEFRKTIQQNHLDILPERKSCIITDYKEINLDENNNIVDSKGLVYIDLPKNKKTKNWQWNFDMSKTYHKDFNTVFKVKGIEL